MTLSSLVILVFDSVMLLQMLVPLLQIPTISQKEKAHLNEKNSMY